MLPYRCFGITGTTLRLCYWRAARVRKSGTRSLPTERHICRTPYQGSKATNSSADLVAACDDVDLDAAVQSLATRSVKIHSSSAITWGGRRAQSSCLARTLLT